MDNKNIVDEEDDEIDLLHLFQVLISKIWIIILVTVIGGAAGFGVSAYLIEPEYQSSAMFYVNNNNLSIGSTSLSISSADISASQSLVDTYIVILETRNTLETVIEKGNLDYTYNQLKGMISASAVDSTEVFKVTVTSTSAKEACEIANTIASVLPDKISEIVTGSGAKIVDYAVVEPNKVSPSIKKYCLIGAAIGFVLTCGIIILKDLFDDTIRDESFLLNTYGDLPMLAVIPNLMADNSKSYYKNGSYSYFNNNVEQKENDDVQ